MGLADCPYCSHSFIPNNKGDIVDYGPSEVTCPSCGKVMMVSAEADLLFDTEKISEEDQAKKGTVVRRHVHISIQDALTWDDDKILTVLETEDGSYQSPEETRRELREDLKNGITVISSVDCNNKNPDGTCAGHPKSTSGGL